MSDVDQPGLVSKAQSGDCKAFTALIEPHLRRIYVAAREIAINEALMTVRKSQSEGRYLSEDCGRAEASLAGIRDQRVVSDPETLCAESERKTLLREAIGQLEFKARSAVCLLALEERGTSETAEICRLTDSGLRSRFQRALRQLRIMLSARLGNSLPLRIVPCQSQE